MSKVTDEQVEIAARALCKNQYLAGHAEEAVGIIVDYRWKEFARDAKAALEAVSAVSALSASSLNPEAPVGADQIVSALYRRFKEWSKRGFGPDDVTWCEVKAEIIALIGLYAHPAPLPKDGAVKALQWNEQENEDGVEWIEACPVRYEVFHKASDVGTLGVQLAKNGNILRFYPDEDAAKAAAQADFDALTPNAGEIEAGGEVDLVEQLRLQAKHEKDFFEGNTHASRAMVAAASHIEAADKRIAELEAALTRVSAIKYPAVGTIYALKATIDYARDQARAALESLQ